MKDINSMTRIELAQYIIDEFQPEHGLKGKVVEVIIPDRLEATIVLDNCQELTVTGLFAARLNNVD